MLQICIGSKKCFAASILLGVLCSLAASAEEKKPFPAVISEEKPGQQYSAAVDRLYDQWTPYEDRGNELYSNFKYTPLEGLELGRTISRRDPSKIIRHKGKYYVWYTYRNTETTPKGPQNATDTIPSYDWDLSDIWYATSEDGFAWEEQGPAVERLPKPQYGWRSISTTCILKWKGRCYLYYQGFNEVPGRNGDRAAAMVAEADLPDGPWHPQDKVIIDFGAPEDWDANAIHDPYPLVYNGKIYLYYKGQPLKLDDGKERIIRAQGVATAEHPLGPFAKSALNPVLNSGHETCMFPWKGGIAAILSLDGPEKNTIQFAPDGLNFEVMSHVQMLPLAPGPYVPDAFAGNGNGRGITWGLCHISDKESGAQNSILARFDCDLSLDVDRPLFKKNNIRFNAATYFQKSVALPPWWRQQIENEPVREME